MIIYISIWVVCMMLNVVLCNLFDVWLDDKKGVCLFDTHSGYAAAYGLGPVGLALILMFGILEMVSRCFAKLPKIKISPKCNPKIS